MKQEGDCGNGQGGGTGGVVTWPKSNAFRAMLGCLLLLFALLSGAHALTQAELKQIEFRQYPGRQLPLNVGFIDDRGATVLLKTYFEGKPPIPVIVVPGYFRCETLCSGLSDGLIRALQGTRKTAGRDFRVVYISIDPAEQQTAAVARKRAWVQRYARLGTENGCTYLRGASGAISEFASRIGFDYQYDPESREFAHPAGFLVASPDGRISSYFFGVSFSAGDLDRALDTAARSEVESPAQRLWMLCFRDGPGSEKGDAVIRGVRYLTFGTLVGLGLLMIRANRAKRNRRNEQEG
jgi:protein SCO1/2